ncbi:MAG: 1-deoxy-D-xylulose-5-phosphate synthase [Bacteroidaceae bacterium]|nr:1-deoxy-D-xylulose-5-phosphate synthase [Bacteroidaceae bacterium]MBQ9170713.1 1-deoxy-D-xylulose-5-phosphate synthase [Bacteroidaceae bacterium]MBQ9293638.1 1-deoxy-D-xylulose-5-phosphate synthase [Bacteroidaceae bacterium]
MKKEPQELLKDINFPSDLRALPLEALPQVCDELRQEIIREMASNPGHFASSLGVVELTVALHYVFNTPFDRIVWDVGHQAAGHKILTGRREDFHTYRHFGGLRPFPSPEESEYDTFACGHASNSISAALGMAVAAHQQGQDERKVVAVIGDGSMSGGLAFEGLNNASSTPNNLLIILNDNNMSIDRSVGGLKHYLHQLHTSSLYNSVRFRLSNGLVRLGVLSEKRRQKILRFNNSVKALLVGQQNIFEGLNIRYFGPADGHNVIELVNTLRQIKDMKGPKLLHLHTIKGKGFKAAEKDPTVFHAPGKYDPETGERLKDNTEGLPPKYQDVFGETLLELARQNKKIVGITPAMATGCSLTIMMKEMPERTFDVGIAEGHAVTFAGGLAKEGLTPFCNIYSSFSQRAFDSIIHDVALCKLPVVFCFDRAGLVGQDGATHHGAFDLAALRPIPNLTISSPMNEHELRKLMYTAQLPGKGPFVIRYPRGRGVLTDWRCPLEELPIGKGRKLSEGKDVAVLSLGPIGNVVAKVVQELQKEGHHVAHYDMRFLKPIDEGILQEVGTTFRRIVTVEDGVVKGGLGSAVIEYMSDHNLHPQIVRLGLPDHFVEHGTPEELYHLVGLDAEAIKKTII